MDLRVVSFLYRCKIICFIRLFRSLQYIAIHTLYIHWYLKFFSKMMKWMKMRSTKHKWIMRQLINEITNEFVISAILFIRYYVVCIWYALINQSIPDRVNRELLQHVLSKLICFSWFIVSLTSRIDS